METFNSLFTGIVVHDSDLLNQSDTRPYNRVKVFIDGITDSVEESFQQPRGRNNPNTITQSTLDVIGREFYALVMQPVVGSGAATYYNANKDIISVSDTGDVEDINGIPPADSFYGIKDAFVGGRGRGTAGVNPTANAYSPDNRSNSYKGMMSIPGVGSSVVVSFIHGLQSQPIVLGYLPSAASIDSIYGLGLRNEMYPNTPFAYSNLTERSVE